MMIVLVDRKTDGFQDEISLDIKKFAWNRKGLKEKSEAVLENGILPRLCRSRKHSEKYVSSVVIHIAGSSFPISHTLDYKDYPQCFTS